MATDPTIFTIALKENQSRMGNEHDNSKPLTFIQAQTAAARGTIMAIRDLENAGWNRK